MSGIRQYETGALLANAITHVDTDTVDAYYDLSTGEMRSVEVEDGFVRIDPVECRSPEGAVRVRRGNGISEFTIALATSNELISMDPEERARNSGHRSVFGRAGYIARSGNNASNFANMNGATGDIVRAAFFNGDKPSLAHTLRITIESQNVTSIEYRLARIACDKELAVSDVSKAPPKKLKNDARALQDCFSMNREKVRTYADVDRTAQIFFNWQMAILTSKYLPGQMLYRAVTDPESERVFYSTDPGVDISHRRYPYLRLSQPFRSPDGLVNSHNLLAAVINGASQGLDLQQKLEELVLIMNAPKLAKLGSQEVEPSTTLLSSAA